MVNEKSRANIETSPPVFVLIVKQCGVWVPCCLTAQACMASGVYLFHNGKRVAKNVVYTQDLEADVFFYRQEKCFCFCLDLNGEVGFGDTHKHTDTNTDVHSNTPTCDVFVREIYVRDRCTQIPPEGSDRRENAECVCGKCVCSQVSLRSHL